MSTTKEASKWRLPTVSVLVAVRNQERFIGRCIRSILNQNYPLANFEIIVVNDASTDRTRYGLELFGQDVRVIDNPQQLGLPASLNVGIRAAKGRFTVRVDGDDYVHAEYVNMMALHLSLNSWMDAVACDYHVVDDNENILRTENCMEAPIGCGIMFRVEHLVDLGLYDEDFLMHEDKDLRIRFLEKHQIYRVALPLYRYRRHDNNMTNDQATMKAHLKGLEKKHGAKKVPET